MSLCQERKYFLSRPSFVVLRSRMYSRRQHSLSLLTESDDKDTEKKLFFVRLSLPTSQFAFYPCLLSRQSFVCIYTTMGVFPKYVIQVEV